ncbi:MAG: hypothetical protein ABW328_20620 [Ilumatobacteraceae bacterium]
MSDQPSPDRQVPNAGRAVRLIIRYDGDEMTVESRQRLDMRVPLGTAGEVEEVSRAGVWLEVRDGAGEALLQQPLRDPIPRDTEVFSDDPEHSVARIPTPSASGVFTVLVPDLDGADHVALMERSADPGGAELAGEREIARFDLHD